MYKKRGLIFVVFIMVFILQTTLADQHDISPYTTCPWFGDTDNDCDSNAPMRCQYPSNEDDYDCSNEFSSGINTARGSTTDGRGCGLAMDEPGTWDDDCAVRIVGSGNILDNEWRDTGLYFKAQDYWEADGGDGGGAAAAACFVNNLRKHRDGDSYICAADNLWYKCDDAHEGGIIYGESDQNFMFECVCGERCGWGQKGKDDDRDGFLKNGDPLDDPSQNPAGVDCPILRDWDIVGKTLEGIQQEARSLCSDLQFSGCAICQNPSGAEVCGDGVDNDGDLKTPDNCQQNREACMQAELPIEENEDGTPKTIQQRNIYDKSFDFQAVDSEFKCCGYRGMDDLGMIGRTDPQNSFLCFQNEDGSWKWLDDSVEAFQIKTIKTVEENQLITYDVVSNGQGWYECDADALNNGPFEEGDPLDQDHQTLPPPRSRVGENVNFEDLREKSNRFYCFEGDKKFQWVECPEYSSGDFQNLASYREVQNADKNVRLVGDGLMKLPYPESFPEPIDFTGYDQLEFLVRFVKKEGDNFVPVPPAITPFNIKLSINGPNDQIYFSDNVLGSASNGVFVYDENNKPVLPGEDWQNKWLHIVVDLPLSDLIGVEGIEIIPTSDVNKIQVKNVYLSRKGQSTPLCTGRESSTKNSWVKDIDHYQQGIDIDGQFLCENTYGTKAWQPNAEGTEKRCCGDDKPEYFILDGAENSCWNSQVLAKDKTAGNVGFDIKYSTKQIEVTYPLTSVDWTLKVTAPNQGTYILCPFIFTEERIKEDFDTFNKENPQRVEACDEAESKKYSDVPGYEYQWVLKQPIIADSIAIPVDGWFSENDIVKVYLFGHDPIEIPAYRSFGRFQDLNLGKAYIIEKVGVVTQSIRDAAFSIEFSLYVNSNFDSGSVQLGLDQSPKYLRKIERFTQNFPFDYSFKLESSEDGANVYFFPDKSDADLTLDELQRSDAHIIIETNKAGVTPGESQPVDQPLNKIYPCLSSECLYPLPGFPPYTITNEHPELYDLYVVTEDGDISVPGGEGVTVNEDQLGESGIAMLRAVRVPQQVLFTEDAFYGCQIPRYVKNLKNANNQQLVTEESYCSVKSGFYCSPRDGQLFNSWNDNPVPLYKYDLESKRVSERCVEGEVDSGGRPLPGCTFEGAEGSVIEVPVSELKQPTSVILPGKNLVPNPTFTHPSGVLSSWKLFDENVNVNDIVTEQTITTPGPVGVTLSVPEKPPAVFRPTVIWFESHNQQVFEINVGGSGLCRDTGNWERGDPYNQGPLRELIGYCTCPTNSQWNDRTGCTCEEGYVAEELTEGPNNNQGRTCSIEAPAEPKPIPAVIPPIPARPQFNVGILSDMITITPGDYRFTVNGGDNCKGSVILLGDGKKPKQELQEDFNVAEGYSFARIALTGSCSQPFLYLKDLTDSDKSFQFNPNEDDSTPNQLDALSCCPSGSCWNGFTCVNNMATSTFQVENVDGFDELPDGTRQSRNEYRCVNGVWESPAELKDWQDDFSGFCPQPQQCFVFGNDKSGKQSGFDVDNKVNAQYATKKTDEADFAAIQQQTFSEFYTGGKVPTCINKDEYLLDNRCEGDSQDKKGVWSSRTKFIAGVLLKFAQSANRNDYVLYCSNAQETLVDTVGMELVIIGKNSVSSSGFDGVVDQKVCFLPLSEAGAGQNHPSKDHLVSVDENRCVNNFCVLKYGERTAFGVSLNEPLIKNNGIVNSFVESLGISVRECDAAAATKPTEFVACGNQAWYRKDLNMIIFDKEGMALRGNLVDRLLELLRGIFTPEEDEVLELSGGFDIPSPIAEVDQARTLFVVQQGPKAIRGVKETRGIAGGLGRGRKEQLAVDYENFDTDLCAYVDNVNERDIKLTASCIKDGGIQKVKAIANADFWWPKLTGSLRVGNEE